ncbi:MAG TPA: heme-binding domain-containing protein [Pyrinomonadaceae bacterium]|nr:heme-binding domain-containing protein [Pyrinomonadaceae bacterium]
MKKVFRVLRWIVVAGVICFIAIQFVRPARTNPTAEPTQAIESHLEVTPQVSAIFDRSCNDCHSNKTRWPWYSNVAPVSWFVIDHVNEGRDNVNFSEWGKYEPRVAANLLKQMCRETRAGVMPLSSYTPMHPGAKLSPDDVKTICDWASSESAKILSR